MPIFETKLILMIKVAKLLAYLPTFSETRIYLVYLMDFHFSSFR